MSNAAGVDNSQVRLVGRSDLLEPELFEQLANLLTLILIDFAAKSTYGKSLHNMV